MEEIKNWTYTSKGGYIEIYIHSQERFIKITERDLRTMINFIDLYNAGLTD